MDVPLPWEHVLWSHRSWWRPRFRYTLTDFRIVKQDGDVIRELAVADIADVQVRRTLIDRAFGTASVLVQSRHRHIPAFTFPNLRQGRQLAAMLELLSEEPAGVLDEATVRTMFEWTPPGERGRTRTTVILFAVVAVALSTVAIGGRGERPAIEYPVNDAIYPSGVKRDHEAIADFMDAEVLPWAQHALGPLKGGADRVGCETCHGRNPEARRYKMPAVAALPEPHVEAFGSEVSGVPLDAQMRNAMYGYLAEADNQAKAAYMRQVVVPGMARLLGRPPYDFTKSYEYNRKRFAIGCYHCHMVKQEAEELGN